MRNKEVTRLINLTDNNIIAFLKSNDKTEHHEALRYLYKNHFPPISKYIQKNSGGLGDAEDIFQEGIIAFYEQLINNKFKNASSLKTYLFSICRNMWLKKLRKTSKNVEMYDVPADSEDENLLAYESLIQDEKTKALARLIDQGGDDCKKILLLFYYDKKRMDEIAVMMNYANADVAKNKKNRCMKKIRALAKEKFNFIRNI